MSSGSVSTHVGDSFASPKQSQVPMRKAVPLPSPTSIASGAVYPNQNSQMSQIFQGPSGGPYQHAVLQTPTYYNASSSSYISDTAGQYYGHPPGSNAQYFHEQKLNMPLAPSTGKDASGAAVKPTFGHLQSEFPDGFQGTETDSSSASEKLIHYDGKEVAASLKGWKFLFKVKNRWRARKPNAFQLPGYLYMAGQRFRHRDSAGRVSTKPAQDRYLHPMDGRLRKLIVASSDEIYEAPGTSTWRRTYVRNVAPWNVRIATWVIDCHPDPNSWRAWFHMLLRAMVANIALQVSFYVNSYTFFTEETARWMFEGKYAPVPIEYNGNAKVWSNHLENQLQGKPEQRDTQPYRVLKPRSLCFLRDQQGVDIRAVEEWENTDKPETLSYIFVAYSTEQFKHDSVDDMLALHSIGEQAARDAGVVAYWVGASNLSSDEKELESDVYRISDVLRSAHSLVIAVGRPSTAVNEVSTNDLLRQWGDRIWTFPEVLLSPGRKISVYTRGANPSLPMVLGKNQFASRAWRSRVLIDHYLGNLSLSKLELAVTALQCIYDRNTTQYLPGDHAYALMGLLRMRPKIDRSDSSFEAFARITLANDSERILERLLGTLPKHGSDWLDISDVYESSLWDIEPYCQVAGICGRNSDNPQEADTDAIILDGAFAASIQWKSFYPVKYFTGFSWKRWLSVQLMENNGMLLSIALFAWAIGRDWSRNGKPVVDHALKFLSGIHQVFSTARSLTKREEGKDAFDNVTSWASEKLPEEFKYLLTNVTFLNNSALDMAHDIEHIFKSITTLNNTTGGITEYIERLQNASTNIPESIATQDSILPYWLVHFAAICTGVAAVFFILYLWTWLSTPTLIKAQYGGKFRGCEAALFGFEGYMSAATIERAIFGGNFNRMKWSISGSPLSRSYVNNHCERYGKDPTSDSDVMQKVIQSRQAKPGDARVNEKSPRANQYRRSDATTECSRAALMMEQVFTLVDT